MVDPPTRLSLVWLPAIMRQRLSVERTRAWLIALLSTLLFAFLTVGLMEIALR